MKRREFITLLARQYRAALGLNIHPDLLHAVHSINNGHRFRAAIL
jgi:hypothetical protein